HLSDWPMQPVTSTLTGMQAIGAEGRSRIETPVSMFGTHQESTPNRRGIAGIVFAVALIVGVGAVILLGSGGSGAEAEAEAGATGTAPEAPPPAPTRTIFTVVTEPAGAEVVVDGEVLGKSPVTF